MKLITSIVCLFIFASAAVACGSAAPTSDDVPTDTMAPTPMSIPADTNILLRMNPDKFAQIADQADKVLPPNQQFDFPEGLDVADLFIEVLLTNDGDRALLADGSLLSHRDADRELLLAVSWRGNEDIIRTLRAGVPFDIDEAQLHPLASRLFIAGDDKLVGELEELCGEDYGLCPNVLDISRDSEFALVDLKLGEFGANYSAETLLPDEINSSFFDRDTSAARAFYGRDAGISFYTRGESLYEMAGLHGFIEVWDALTFANPESRLRMMLRGIQLAGNTFTMQSPEANQYEDLAILFSADETGRLITDLYQSHTTLGAHIFEASLLEIQLPDINIAEPSIEFEWAGDWPAAREAAVEPYWLKQAPETGGYLPVAEFMRDSGIWAYLLPLLNYPTGIMKSLETISADAPSEISELISAIHGLVGLRGKIAIVEDAMSPVGIGIRGGVALAVEPDATDSLMAMIEIVRQQGILAQLQLSVTTTTSGEYSVIQIGSGDHDEMFINERVVEDLGFRLDPSTFPASHRTGPDNSDFGIFNLPGTDVAITRKTAKPGMATRVVIGKGDLESLSVPQTSATLIQPTIPSECYRNITKGMRQLTFAREYMLHDQWATAMTQEIEELQKRYKDCQVAELSDGESEELGWIMDRWSNFDFGDYEW